MGGVRFGQRRAYVINERTRNSTSLFHVLLQATFSRNNSEGTLIMDNGAEVVNVVSPGTLRTVEVQPPYFIGGLSTDVVTAAATNVEVCLSSIVFGAYLGCVQWS